MRKYETIFVMKPDLDEAIKANIPVKMKAIIEREKGTVHVSHDLGKQRLSYEVKKETKGHYHYLGFEGQGEIVKEVEKNLRLNEGVMKFVSFRVEGDFNHNLNFITFKAPSAAAPMRRRDGGDFDGPEMPAEEFVAEEFETGKEV